MSAKLSDDQKEQLRLAALELAVGDSTRKIGCPVCKISGDFSLSRIPAGLWYKCWRAKCGVSGLVGSTYTASLKNKKKEPKYFKEETVRLNKLQRQFFKDTYEISSEQLQLNHVKWCPEKGRIVFPCMTMNGMIWGYNTRYYKELDVEGVGEEKPKSVLYQENTNAVGVSWPTVDFAVVPQRYVVLVEDQVSAIALSSRVQTCCLLGHQIPDNLWPLIRLFTVVLALDADVTNKVIKYLDEYKLRCKQLVAVQLTKDPKDTLGQDREELFNRLLAMNGV